MRTTKFHLAHPGHFDYPKNIKDSHLAGTFNAIVTAFNTYFKKIRVLVALFFRAI